MIHTDNFKCGLLGEHLSHSFSPQIHAHLADYEYKLYEMAENEVGTFLKNCPLDAMNVTIPYKKTVMPFLDFISEEAQKIGSVNTIVKKDGKLFGYNTDYYGFMHMIKSSGITIKGKKVLVLGTGGASLTVKAVLKDLEADKIISVSRSGEVNYDNITDHSNADIIVNTTPVGMFPNNGVSPVNPEDFPSLSGVLDLIYNPARTALLCQAEKLGVPFVNGLVMLVSQAKRACEYFLDCTIDDSENKRITEEIAKQSENIVLIGMPSSGKSTAGKKLAEMLGREFVDTDEVIVEMAGMSIPEIFSKYGEEHFRKIEHEAVKQTAKRSGLVIATGGGVVTRQENYLPLHENGRIVFIERDINELSTDGRPLSQKGNLEKMYEIRLPLYLSFCDAKAQCETDVTKTVENILKAVNI